MCPSRLFELMGVIWMIQGFFKYVVGKLEECVRSVSKALPGRFLKGLPWCFMED